MYKYTYTTAYILYVLGNARIENICVNLYIAGDSGEW